MTSLLQILHVTKINPLFNLILSGFFINCTFSITKNLTIMKKIIFLVLISFLFFNSIYSQVAINTDGSDPNNHAMLDVQSSTMGLLVPRMLTSERNTFESALGATEKGMLVYDTDLGSFYFFDGTNFVKIQQGVITNLEDADSDTKIEVERTADDDLIYFSLGGDRPF